MIHYDWRIRNLGMIRVEINGNFSDAIDWCSLRGESWTWCYPFEARHYDGRYWFYFKSLETAAEFKLRFG